jgi:hypothetical protein
MVSPPVRSSLAGFHKEPGTPRRLDRCLPLLSSGANRRPRPAVLFYTTDDARAATQVERLIRIAGFEPMAVDGGVQEGAALAHNDEVTSSRPVTPTSRTRRSREHGRAFTHSEPMGATRRLEAQAPGDLTDAVGAVPLRIRLAVPSALARASTVWTKPSKRGIYPLQHDAPPVVLRPSHALRRMAVTNLTARLSP